MVSEKLINIYYKNLKKPTIINGLVLHPFMVDGKIIWEIDNVNDVSYSSYVVEGRLEHLLSDFLDLAGVKPDNWNELSVNYCRVTEPDVYINDEVRNKINKSLENFDNIILKDSGEILKTECFVKDWSIEYRDEELLFHLDLELFNPKLDNIDIDDDQLQDFIQSFIYDDTSIEQEWELIQDQISIIYSEKNLFDDVYMFSTAVIGYYDTFGNGLT
jgi:hypothetical protein